MCIEFDAFMHEWSRQTMNGIFFVMVRLDSGDEPTIETLYSSETNNTNVYVIFANRDMKDAGEIYINNHHKVVDYIRGVIMAYSILV